MIDRPRIDLIEDEKASPWRYIGILLVFPLIAAAFWWEVSTWETSADLPRRLAGSQAGAWMICALFSATTVWVGIKLAQNRAKFQGRVLDHLAIVVSIGSLAAISLAMGMGAIKAGQILEAEQSQ